MALGVVLNTEANGRTDRPPPAFDGAQSLMGDNITRELVALHATDDAKHTVLKLFISTAFDRIAVNSVGVSPWSQRAISTASPSVLMASSRYISL